jgi:hypothetical protein
MLLILLASFWTSQAIVYGLDRAFARVLPPRVPVIPDDPPPAPPDLLQLATRYPALMTGAQLPPKEPPRGL